MKGVNIMAFFGFGKKKEEQPAPQAAAAAEQPAAQTAETAKTANDITPSRIPNRERADMLQIEYVSVICLILYFTILNSEGPSPIRRTVPLKCRSKACDREKSTLNSMVSPVEGKCDTFMKPHSFPGSSEPHSVI